VQPQYLKEFIINYRNIYKRFHNNIRQERLFPFGKLVNLSKDTNQFVSYRILDPMSLNFCWKYCCQSKL